jgi:glycosyltransferase involved in cell wall biosynthesis
MEKNKKKILITLRVAFGFRMPFFRLLNEKLIMNNKELKVFSGSNPNNYNDNFLKIPFSYILNVSWGGMNEIVVIMPLMFFNILKYKPDLIITEGSSFLPNSIFILIYSKLFKIPFIVWGLGDIPNKKPWKFRFLIDPLINFYESQANAFMCYSSYGKQFYNNKYEKLCYIAYNSIEKSHSDVEYDEVKSNIYKKYSTLKNLNIVFIGRLNPQKKVEMLLNAVKMINIPFHLYIVGDGYIKDELIDLSKNLEINDKVSFLGEINDRKQKEKIFKKMHLGVLPGLGGLAIQEMLWHGIPVISSSADGTEIDLISKSKGGFYVEQMDVNSLHEAIINFYHLNEKEKVSMALRGLEVIQEKYNLDCMVKRFTDSIDNMD